MCAFSWNLREMHVPFITTISFLFTHLVIFILPNIYYVCNLHPSHSAGSRFYFIDKRFFFFVNILDAMKVQCFRPGSVIILKSFILPSQKKLMIHMASTTLLSEKAPFNFFQLTKKIARIHFACSISNNNS